LVGKSGVLRVALVDYGGFEPVQRLVGAVVIEGIPIDPLLAGQFLRLPASDGVPLGEGADPKPLDDALDEAVFVDQREVEKSEQKHFEQAISQLERFIEDKILVCRRERTSISEKLRAARERRDRVVGSTAREQVEAEMARLTARDESLERRINALDSREDEVYRKWRNQYHELRYQAPRVKRLFEATFRILAASPEKSC
jgi:hypothetical protein